MKKIYIVFFVLIIITLISCQKNTENVTPVNPQPSATLTSTLINSNTITPTQTITLTSTITPTSTDTPTVTISPTFTITMTYTATSLPTTIYIKCIGTPSLCNHQDTLIIEEAPYNNYGNLGVASIGTDGTANHRRRALFYFDLSSIPSNAEIIDARLIFYISNFQLPTNEINIFAYRMTSQWNETTATWNSLSGGSYDAQIGANNINNPIQDTGYTLFLDKNKIKEWIDGTKINYGFILISNTEDGSNSDWISIYTKEVEQENFRPYLMIIYRP